MLIHIMLKKKSLLLKIQEVKIFKGTTKILVKGKNILKIFKIKIIMNEKKTKPLNIITFLQNANLIIFLFIILFFFLKKETNFKENTYY